MRERERGWGESEQTNKAKKELRRKANTNLLTEL
jgi:hypothetical protein